MDELRTALVVLHLGLLAIWLGSMAYSLAIVQPRTARFLADDDDALEEFLTLLGAGNRRPVAAIVAAIALTLAGLVGVERPSGSLTVLYGVEAGLVLAAAVTFWRVSWVLWPQRAFALRAERPAHRRALHRHAVVLTALVGTAFVAAVVAAIGG